MAAIIFPSTQFNPASVAADGVYLAIQNPPGFTTGVPTDVFGTVGSADWGPVNQPVQMGNAYDALQAWGPVSAAALTDPYDLATDLAICFGQASSEASMEGWAVRVTDGTDAAAAISLGGVPASGETLTVAGTAHAGDVLTVVYTSSAITGSPLTVTYTMKTGDTLATGAAGLAAAINATAALNAVGIYATSAAAVCTSYQPAALSPAATYTASVTGGGATTTLTAASTTAPTGGMTLTAIYTGALGNQLQATIAAGSQTNTWNVTLALPVLGITEQFTNLPTTGFWLALKNALVLGQSGVRGPSQLARGTTLTTATIGGPAAASFTCAGGASGRGSITVSNLLGSDTAVPKTGLYALRGVNPALGVCWIVGSTDSTLPASLVQFGQSEGPEMLFPFPTGTTTAGALVLLQGYGQATPALTYCKDWVYWFDAINNVTRLVPPTAFSAGRICTLSPQINPGNEQVSLVQGTERNNPQSGVNQPYSLSELGQCANAGIMVITNPIPQGPVWGIYSGQSTSLNAVTKGIEWWRTTIFLARSVAATMGKYVDMNQSQQPNDPTRNMVKNDLNSLFALLVGSNGTLGVIDSYAILCTFSSTASPGNGVNTPTSIAQGYMFVLIKATYLGTARFIIVALQGGTTVVSVGASPAGQQQVSN